MTERQKHREEIEMLRRQHPAMAGDDLTVITDQHWVGEAEAGDAVGNLTDLLLSVGAGIARVGA